MKFPGRIEAKPTVMMGKPCVKGARIPADLRACEEYAAARAAAGQ